MKKFRIIRTMKYTEECVVEALTEEEALEISEGLEFERNYDDWCYSEEVKEVS